MKHAFAFVLLNVALTGWSVYSAPPPPVFRRQPPIVPLVAALDANHDRVISASEIANASAALEELDENNDGQLTENEYLHPLPPFGRFRRGPPPRSGNGERSDSSPHGGLGNFGIVDAHLIRGAEPGAAAIQTLKAMGVSTIINLIPSENLWNGEKAEADTNGILYTNIPMKSFGRPAPEQVDAVLSVITNAIGKVFVHCKAGKDRTGTIVACYRIAQSGWTSEQALREANEYDMARTQFEMKEFVADFAKLRASSGND